MLLPAAASCGNGVVPDVVAGVAAADGDAACVVAGVVCAAPGDRVCSMLSTSWLTVSNGSWFCVRDGLAGVVVVWVVVWAGVAGADDWLDADGLVF